MARKSPAGSAALPARPKSNRHEDRIAVLPEHVRRRLAVFSHQVDTLNDQETGAFAASQAAYQRLEAARTDKLIAEERVASGEGDPVAVEEAKQRVADATRAYDAAAQKHRDVIRERAIAKDLLGDSKRFIASTPVETLVDARPASTKSVEEERAEVARLMRERDEVAMAPVSINEALDDIKRQVEEAARNGMPSVSGAAMPAREDERGQFHPAKVKVTWPVRRLHEVEPNRLRGDTSAPVIVDTERVIMALMADRLLALLEEEVREAYAVEGVEGIDATTRHRRIRELKRQIFDAQRRAAEAAWQALGRGESIEWWPEIPPAALLGLRVDEELQRQFDKAAGAGRAAA